MSVTFWLFNCQAFLQSRVQQTFSTINWAFLYLVELACLHFRANLNNGRESMVGLHHFCVAMCKLERLPWLQKAADTMSSRCPVCHFITSYLNISWQRGQKFNNHEVTIQSIFKYFCKFRILEFLRRKSLITLTTELSLRTYLLLNQFLTNTHLRILCTDLKISTTWAITIHEEDYECSFLIPYVDLALFD